MASGSPVRSRNRSWPAVAGQLGDELVGAGVLPDDGVVHRLAGAAVPQHGGLALVGDADRGQVGRGRGRPARSALVDARLRRCARSRPASCSTQPGRGKICRCSRWSTATIAPAASKTMHRDEVVPWSMAAMKVTATVSGRLARVTPSAQPLCPAGGVLRSPTPIRPASWSTSGRASPRDRAPSAAVVEQRVQLDAGWSARPADVTFFIRPLMTFCWFLIRPKSPPGTL